jgi:uncharacterized membrane protein YbaN (DUF454 family)
LKRILLLVAGTLFVVIGIIGIFVPILPTTPFLLLAAACYVRSSQRFYDWLLNNKYLGTYIRNYVQGKGMSLKAKAYTIILLWMAIGLSIWFVTENVIVRVILALIAIGVTLHLINTKTFREKGKLEEKKNEQR